MPKAKKKETKNRKFVLFICTYIPTYPTSLRIIFFLLNSAHARHGNCVPSTNSHKMLANCNHKNTTCTYIAFSSQSVLCKTGTQNLAIKRVKRSCNWCGFICGFLLISRCHYLFIVFFFYVHAIWFFVRFFRMWLVSMVLISTACVYQMNVFKH